MPKLNAVLMVVLAVAVIAAMAFLTLRPTAAESLEPAQVQRLLRKLGDADPDLRREGESELRKLGLAAVAPLKEASKSPDKVLAGRAAKLLLEVQPGPAAEPSGTPTE